MKLVIQVLLNGIQNCTNLMAFELVQKEFLSVLQVLWLLNLPTVIVWSMRSDWLERLVVFNQEECILNSLLWIKRNSEWKSPIILFSFFYSFKFAIVARISKHAFSWSGCYILLDQASPMLHSSYWLL